MFLINGLFIEKIALSRRFFFNQAIAMAYIIINFSGRRIEIYKFTLRISQELNKWFYINPIKVYIYLLKLIILKSINQCH